MSSKFTRAYMRGRLYTVLISFVLAVAVGTGFILWKLENAKIDVKFGAVIGYMAEATSDVIYQSLRLEHLSASLQSQVRNATTAPMAPVAGPAPLGAAGPADVNAVHAELAAALKRLERAYDTLETSSGAERRMLESRRIAIEEGGGAAQAPLEHINTVFDAISGLRAPLAVRQVWDDSDSGMSLKTEIRQVLTLANRLEIFADYTTPSAQRVFRELQQLANRTIKPHLALIQDDLSEDMAYSYTTLQWFMVLVGLTIVLASALVGLRILDPMMQKVATSHENLREAHESIEAALERAESADRAKSEFLANMSHEIRTPMNGVLGMAELLSRSELDKRQAMFVDVILKSGSALLTIINDILDFSKIDAGQLELDPAPFRLGEAIEDVATLVSARVAEKDLELIVRVDPNLPSSVTGDVGRFRQIITNLVGNAVKFTEKGHVLIDVSGTVDKGIATVTVHVEDTGIGIPEAKLASVFDKFAQVDASSTRRHEGTGLGLAIASRLVELMDGRISADSVLGKGSAFWFTVRLPVDETDTGDRPVPFDVSGARILIVDDNPINRDILSEQMRSWGFECAAVENGETGLAFLKRASELGARVDCVVLDYQMPGMNGVETARAITADPATAAIPILLLTSVDQSDVGRLAAECGIRAQLPKPARSSALLEAIVTMLQAARAAMTAPEEKPAVPPPGQRTAPRRAAERRISAASLRKSPDLDVLVAEDNEVNQLVFRQILDGLDLSYRIASNGRMAVEMHRSLRPRIVLMDVSMPEMNGLEATRTIRKAEAGTGEHTPIIGITAHALKGDRDKCMDAGMDDYLSKPVSPNKLSIKIETWLRGGDMARTA
ncbi:MAG: response regulator [Nitratireductor sp.]|uniref:response regulator n=1 Tax=Parasphingorhabdus sp. TaxID=2709688 RepID=UPI003269226F